MRTLLAALLLVVGSVAMAGEPAVTDSYGNTSALSGASQSYWCWFDGSWNEQGGTYTGPTTINVTALVKPWATETLEASQIDFTFNRTGVNLLSAGLNNTCFANFAYRIYVTAGPVDPTCVITKMKLSTPTAYGTGQDWFPIVWKYKKQGGALTNCDYDEANNFVKGPTYGSGGHGVFDWFVEAQPVEHQKPGGYVLDPCVVMEPDM